MNKNESIGYLQVIVEAAVNRFELKILKFQPDDLSYWLLYYVNAFFLTFVFAGITRRL